MQEMVVHGQGSGEEGGPAASSEEAGVPVSGDGGDGGGVVARGFSTGVGSARGVEPGRGVSEPFVRCSNCGLPGHLTQHCPRHGPFWPEPGKTREDYADLIQEIADKNAGDILREHEGHEDRDNYVPKKVALPPGGE